MVGRVPSQTALQSAFAGRTAGDQPVAFASVPCISAF